MSNQIYELIPKMMADIGAVSKSHTNTGQKYQFRGIEDFYLAAHPAMVKHGVFCAPEVLERNEYRFEKVNEYGKASAWVHVSLRVCHRFYAADGSHVPVTTWGEGLDNSDKATNKAMSGAMKYALIELFCVPTKDVEDSDRESPEVGMARSGKPVERIEKDIPLDNNETVLPPAEQLISVEQQKKLHLRFKEELSDELKPQADALLRDFFARKLIMGPDGNPSAKGILKSEYTAIGKEAIALAKTLSQLEVA